MTAGLASMLRFAGFKCGGRVVAGNGSVRSEDGLPVGEKILKDHLRPRRNDNEEKQYERAAPEDSAARFKSVTRFHVFNDQYTIRQSTELIVAKAVRLPKSFDAKSSTFFGVDRR